MVAQEEMAHFLRAQIAAQIAETGRTCGSCSLCCKLLDIDERGKGTGDFVKPAHVWCRDCKPNKNGCSIYDHRPEPCRDYACQWLLNPGMSDDWYPAKCGIVITFVPKSAERIGGDLLVSGTLQIVVNSGAEARWKTEPYLPTLMALAADGLSTPAQRQIKVFEKSKTYLVLPNKIVELKNKDEAYTIVPAGNGSFDIIRGSAEFVSRLVDVMNKTADFVKTIDIPPSLRAALPHMHEMQRLEAVMKYATSAQQEQFKSLVSSIGEKLD